MFQFIVNSGCDLCSNSFFSAGLGHSILSVIFYLLMVGFVLYSLFAIYSLLRFGRSKIIGISVSIIFLIIAASLYAAAVSSLNNI